MAEEPKKKIEELLQAYSRKRREDAGPPLEMHGATRRMLQGEVARQQGKAGGASSASPRPWWKTLLLFGPRYAGAVGMFAILALGVWVITQHERQPRNVPGETSERRVGAEAESTRPLGEAAARDGEKLSEADSFADSRSPAKQIENKKAELAKTRGAASEQPRMQSRDKDSQSLSAARPAAPQPQMAEELAREKELVLQKEPQLGQRIATVVAGGGLTSADKNATVLADSSGVPENRFYKRNEGKADFVTVPAPALQPAPARLDFAAAAPSNANYFAYSLAAPLTNVTLGAEATTALYAGAKLAITTNAPAETYLRFGNRADAPVTEWAAVLADPAKDQLERARERRVSTGVAQEAEFREGSNPPFLRRFSVEQNNGSIRIRDADDGSVYLGEIVAASASESNVDAKAKALNDEAQLRRRVEDAQSSALTFRASGINQRSKEVVIINGQLTQEQAGLDAIAGKVVESPAAAAPGASATAPPAPTTVLPSDAPQRDQASAADRQARTLFRSSAIAPTSGPSRATSVPVFRPATLRARVQIGPTNELDLRAVRTR